MSQAMFVVFGVSPPLLARSRGLINSSSSSAPAPKHPRREVLVSTLLKGCYLGQLQPHRGPPIWFEVRLYCLQTKQKNSGHPSRLCVKWKWSARAVHLLHDLLLRRSAKIKLIYPRRCQPHSAGVSDQKRAPKHPRSAFLIPSPLFFEKSVIIPPGSA